MKKNLPLIILVCVTGCLNGCMSAGRPVAYNPDAVYRVPAKGLWTEGLIDADTGRIQGLMYVPPGTFIFTDGESIQ